MARRDMPPGCAFSPAEHELTDDYLRGMIVGQPVPGTADFIHAVDLYSAAPEELAKLHEHAKGSGEGDKRVWYFFTTVRYVGKNKNARARGGSQRKSRTIGGSDGKQRWHAEAALKAVEGSAAGGRFQKFSYKVGSSPGGWLMTEYSIHGASTDLVLCKVYKSPRASSSRSSSSSSSCTTTVAALSGSGSGCKRKAAGDHPEAPTTGRHQTEEDEACSSVWHEANEDVERFRFSGEPTPAPDDLDVHGSSEQTESYMQGCEPAVPPCTPNAETEEVIGFSSARDHGKILFHDAGASFRDLLDTAVPAAEEDASSGADGDRIVLFDAGFTVDDLLDPVLGECNGGLPCPEPAPPCRNELSSASRDTAWEPTDGGRYELLSTYVPPPCGDEEDGNLRWSEAAGTTPLFASSVDSVWGTSNGIMMY